MKIFIIFLLFIIETESVSPSIHLTSHALIYRYSGSIFTSIPELSDQASGFFIRGKILMGGKHRSKIQTHATMTPIKFQDFEFIEMNEKLGRDLKEKIPGVFKPLQDESQRQMLETPFEANLNENQENKLAIVVSKTELLWIKNMKKAIISTLRFEMPSSNLVMDDDTGLFSPNFQNEFKVMEETIHGKCSVDYSLHQLRGDIADTKTEELKRHRIDTENAAKEAIDPDLQNLWKLTRTVNFDDCQYKATFQRGPYRFKNAFGGNHMEYLKGRSSVTSYILRGLFSEGFRIEYAASEGANTKSIYGIHSEHIQTRANQTYQLLSYTKNSPTTLITMPENVTEFVRSWTQEFLSPNPSEGETKDLPWVTYTGLGSAMKRYETFGTSVNLTAEDISKLKETIINKLELASEYLSNASKAENLKESDITQNLYFATKYGCMLSKEDLLNITKHFLNKSTTKADLLGSSIIVDVVASIGSKESTEAISQLILEGKVSTPQILTFASSLTNQLDGPESIPPLLDLIDKFKSSGSPLATINLIKNTANVIHFMCISPRARDINYMGPMIPNCNMLLIKDKFMQDLKNTLKDPSREMWERMTAIDALGNIASPDIIPVLQPIILARTNESCLNNDERVLAIVSLHSRKLYYTLPKEIQAKVLNTLKEIVSNTGENFEIRRTALLILSTWPQDSQYWNLLARLTWTEPSRSMAYYVTSLIETLAEAKNWKFLSLTQATSFAATLTKPVAESEKYSTIYVETKRILDGEIGTIETVQCLKNPEVEGDIGLHYIKYLDAGGFFSTIVETYLTTNMKPILEKYFKETLMGEERGKTYSKGQNVMDKIKSILNFTSKGDANIYNNLFYLRLFEHMQIILPFEAKVMNPGRNYIRKVIKDFKNKVKSGHTFSFATYSTPNHVEYVQSTDLGVPLFTELVSPMVLSHQVKFSTPNLERLDFKNVTIEAEKHLKIAISSGSYSAVLSPWNESLFKVGSVANREITLPVTCLLTSKHVKDGGSHTAINMEISKWPKNKFKILRADHTAVSAIEPLLPLERKGSTKPDFKMLNEFSPKDEKWELLTNSNAGITLSANWRSELRYPLSYWNILEYVKNPEKLSDLPWFAILFTSPTSRHWKFDLELDASSATTKKIDLSYTTGVYGKNASISDFKSPVFTKTYNASIDSQGTIKSKGLADKLIFFNNKTGPSLKTEDSMQARADKIEAFYGEPTPSCSLMIAFRGDTNKTFEMLHTWSKVPWYLQWKHSQHQFAFINSSTSNTKSESSMVCLDIQDLDNDPSLEYFSSLSIARYSKLSVKKNCQGPPVMSIEGTMELLPNSLSKLVIGHLKNRPFDAFQSAEQSMIYENVSLALKWNRELLNNMSLIESKIPLLLETLSNAVFFQYFPDSNENEIQAHILRDEYTGLWDAKVKRDSVEVNVECENMDKKLNSCFSNKNFKYPEHYSVGGLQSEKCVFKNVNNIFEKRSEMRTFDGMVYDYVPSKNNWTVMAKDCTFSNGWILLVRLSDKHGHDLKFISEYDSFNIDIIGDDVKLNGKPYNVTGEKLVDESGIELNGQIVRVNNYFTIRAEKDLYISKNREGIYISIPKDSFNSMCGLCGNYDREEIGEFLGPQQCIYSEPNVNFTTSWTIDAAFNDASVSSQVQRNISDFQRNCRKPDFYKKACPVFY